MRGEPLAGDRWLVIVRKRPSSSWIEAADMVLAPLFEAADPPIRRIYTNELAVMNAWNARLADDNSRFHANVDAPRRAGSKARARPDLRFRELLAL